MAGRIHPEGAVLMLIDWQERLFTAMDPTRQEAARQRVGDLAWIAGELGMPVLISEQYPRGLGPTLEELRVAPVVEKLSFSAMEAAGFAESLAQTGRRQVLLTGMETHICVAQTARDLADHELWVVGDACLTRHMADHELGIRRMEADGAVPISAEAVLFELLGKAGTPLFKEVSHRIRGYSQ